MADDVRPPLSAALVTERLGHRLEGRVSFEALPRARDLSARLERASDLPLAVEELTRELGLAFAMVVATDASARPGRGLEARYLFEPVAPSNDLWVSLEVAVDPQRAEVPSITPLVPAASWHELEMRDLLGIEPVGHPAPRTLVLHDGWPPGLHPLRKSFAAGTRPPVLAAPEFPHLEAEGEGVFEIPVGPIHAGIIEPGHFRFSAVGETVLHLDARLFYTHRGLEKRAEGLAAADALLVAERLCGACSLANGLGFAEAVEQLAEVRVPARARILRTVALELERLYNHAGDLGNLCAGASYHAGTSAGARMKEVLQRANERLTGNRFLRGFVGPGGVHADLSPELRRDLERLVRETGLRVGELMAAIERNPSVVDRLDGTGFLSAEAARDLGVTGVAARASGIDRDARRDHPHAAFTRDVAAPEVITDDAGDVHARMRVRAREAAESVRLVEELLTRLEPGPLRAPVPERLPAWRVGLGVVECPRGASLHWLASDGAGRVDRYHVRTASFANWPAVPLAALSAIVPDFPLVNKSFELCYACTDR